MRNLLDEIAPAFHAACERWPDAPNLKQHYMDLARTWEAEGSSVIELTKSFLEAVCWTVIRELGATPPDSSTPTTTELLSCVLDALGLRNQRGVGPLGKVISGHNKLAEGLNELRNQDGSVAHGRDGFLDAISSRHARVYLLSADSVKSPCTGVSAVGRLRDRLDPQRLRRQRTKPAHNQRAAGSLPAPERAHRRGMRSGYRGGHGGRRPGGTRAGWRSDTG